MFVFALTTFSLKAKYFPFILTYNNKDLRLRPTNSNPSFILFVIATSSLLGVGSPEGWLCAIMTLLAF